VTLWRRNPRKDDNHAEIVRVLRQRGASVVSLSAPGCPDLLVGFVRPNGDRVNLLVEVKRPVGPRGGTSHSRLNDAQEAFRRSWRGDPVWTVRNPLEALALVDYNPEEVE
jgi:Holliday junction resolvase